jgi:FkbM family methyltransferase
MIDFQTSRVHRTWFEKLLLWQCAYETKIFDQSHEVSGRGPTREASVKDAERPIGFERTPCHKLRPDLIYDVGLFDGGDTAYYLFRGYNVVAVDANPLMVEKARSRFAREIQAKRLTVLNVGISETRGTETFWISDVPNWSSFDRTIASRLGTAQRPVSVSGVPFSQLLAQYGVPHYLKIDIQGNERLCVDALKGTRLPKYISVAAENVGDATVLSDEQAVAMLDLLRNVGYQRFKLVNQSDGWRSVRSNAVARFWMRIVTSADRGWLRVRGLSRIAHKFSDSGRIAALGYAFSPHSSGPWGDDVPGPWMTFEKARSTYLRERRSHFSREGMPLYSFWHDWHATY